MSDNQPYGAKYEHTQRTPDPAYIVSFADKSKLQSEINKKDAALLDAQTAYKKMIELLKTNKDLMEEEIDLIKLQRPMGKMSDMSLTIPAGSKLVHIDFTLGLKNNTSVLPTGTNLDFPFAKLYSLTITNDGPAAIVYSTNESKGSTRASAQLLANETDNLGPFNFPTFETLNIALIGGSTSSASIRIRGLA